VLACKVPACSPENSAREGTADAALVYELQASQMALQEPSVTGRRWVAPPEAGG
jgi:hypothetical protein